MIAEKKIAEYGVFTALLNSGMILSSSNYDAQLPKGKILQFVHST